jgi:hypothetical protein
MTRSQIQYILSEFDTEFGSGNDGLYAEDIWLDMDEVSEVILLSNENIYPDRGLQVKFDGDNQLVRIREGYNDAETFVVVREAAATSYSSVIGFMLAKQTSRKSPYSFSSTI